MRKGWTVVHELDAMHPEREFRTMGDHLKGVRSVASWYCWQAVDTVLPTR